MKRPKQLTATFVKRVKPHPDGKPRRYGDGRGGHGLALVVKPTRSGPASKAWSQRLRIRGGGDIHLGLGSYPIVTLAEARKAALANRREAARGRDPRDTRVPTFEAAAGEVIALHAKKWKPGGKSERQWRSSLGTYAFPLIGSKRVDRITTRDVMAVLLAREDGGRPFWMAKPETARRVRQRIGAVMKWAVAQGFRTDNPAGSAIGAALPKNGDRRRHFRSLPHADVPAALERVQSSGAWLGTKLCIEFMVLTAARPGEARLAAWDEIDFDSATWSIPAARYKTGRPHRVPLCPRAVEVLSAAERIRDRRRNALVFPSAMGRETSDGTMTKLLRELGIPAVSHGFRASFRVWCGDSGIAGEVAERALGHVVRNRVEAAYNRGTLFERRREVMDRWGAHCSGASDD